MVWELAPRPALNVYGPRQWSKRHKEAGYSFSVGKVLLCDSSEASDESDHARPKDE